MNDLDFDRSLPDTSSTVRVRGLGARAEIYRDPEGIPHVRAASAHDAFFGQGWVHAQDRLFQMEYDRRRAYGRWAEWVGPAGLEGRRLLRRFRLEASARLDWEHASADARAMLEAFAAGVNAFIDSTKALGRRVRAGGRAPRSLAAVGQHGRLQGAAPRHGPVEGQAVARQAAPLSRARRGPPTSPASPANPLLIVPPAAEYRGGAPRRARGDGAPRLGDGALPGAPQGSSNNWALRRRRTASGKPLVAGDPHRALDVPSVYYQNHLACPDWDAIGLSFPGVPGLPHFGHTARVAWCVTHGMADYQDLYIERFDAAIRAATSSRRVAGGRRPAGDASRCAATRPSRSRPWRRITGPWWPASRAMAMPSPSLHRHRGGQRHVRHLRAHAARAERGRARGGQRAWVEPVNNLVFADVDGHIGYRARGHVPLRSMANAWVPVPGWTGEHEWRGMIPFEEMPVLRDPDAGFVATANGPIAGASYPHYLGLD